MEAFVYRLGGVLGGRQEVIKTPAVELLAYTDMEMKRREDEAEKERARIWFSFVSAQLAHPPQGKSDGKREKAIREFEDTFKPKPPVEAIENKAFEWDEDLMKRLNARQEGG